MRYMLVSYIIATFSKKTLLFPTTTQCRVFKQYVISQKKNENKTLGYQLLPISAPYYSGNFSDTAVRRTVTRDAYRRYWYSPETQQSITQ
jgi:hypothetical protein